MLQWFDTLAGLVVILLAVSLVIMIIIQIIVALFNLRGYNLKKSIEFLITNADGSLKNDSAKKSNEILCHPLISDKWKNYYDKDSGFTKLKEKLKIIPEWGLATTIRKKEFEDILNIIACDEKVLSEDQKRNFIAEKKKIVDWFDSIMDRTSQRFVRQTRFWTIILSIILAFLFHLDFLNYFEQINNNTELRSILVASSEGILNQAEMVVGTSNDTSLVFTEAVFQLKDRDTTGDAYNLSDPPTFTSRKAAHSWIKEQLGESPKTDSLIKQYNEIINVSLLNSLDRLKDRVYSILSKIDSSKFQLNPNAYTITDYSPAKKHFWGVIIMAAFLSLGAPFWFKILKTLSSLRPILATEEDKEKKDSDTDAIKKLKQGVSQQ